MNEKPDAYELKAAVTFLLHRLDSPDLALFVSMMWGILSQHDLIHLLNETLDEWIEDKETEESD